MGLRQKRRAWQGLIGGIGVAAFLAGPLAGLYPLRVAVFAAFAIWIVGTLVVNLLTDD